MKPGTDPGRWVALAAVLVGTFTGAINSSVANVAVLDVLREFELDLATGAWFVLGYTLSFVVLMPVVGRLAGRVGLRRVYLAGMVVFTIASVGAAVGPAYEWVIIARVVQGIGAAPILPVVMLVVAREFRPGSRGRAMGVWASTNGAALALGPVVGGIVTESYGWRAIFWLDVPLALGALALAYAALPADRAAAGRRVDGAGIGLLCGGLAAVMVALSEPPSSASGLLRQAAVAAAGIGLLLGFRWRSHRVPPTREPVIGMSVLRNGAFAMLAAMAGLQMLLLAAVLFATPLMLSTGFGYDMTAVGLLTFLVPVAMVLFGPLAGYLSDRLGAHVLATAGAFALVVSTALLVVGVVGENVAGVVIGLVVTGVGVAAIQAPVAVSVAERIDDADHGAAMGLFHSVRFAGAVAGTSAAAAVVGLVVGGESEASAGEVLRTAFASAYAVTGFVALILLGLVWRLRRMLLGTGSVRSEAAGHEPETTIAI